MKKHNDDPIRRALLTAAEEDARQALQNQPEEAAFSPAYQTWETRFLRDPVTCAKRNTRSPWLRPLRLAACLLVAVSLVFAAPSIIAAFSQGDDLPQVTPTGLVVTVQLEGRQSTAYTCEKFTCVSENGSTLWYWYENLGASTCQVQLYRVGFWKDTPVGDPLEVPPGESRWATWPDPGNHTFYIRVSTLDGGSVHGTLRADQYD